MVLPTQDRAPTTVWPNGRRFAFTMFDDPDAQTTEVAREVYSMLRDLGFRTTKGVWAVRGPRQPSDGGGTCDETAYRDLCLDLQESGFEMGWHNATLHTSTRDETLAALERFKSLFGEYPAVMANHYYCDEAIYWGEDRVSGWRRHLYELLTRYRYRGRSRGHLPDSPLFWGDACRERVRYVRNFTFPQINTLSACPMMPYHDPARPYVQSWFASSDGTDADRFLRLISERNQDKLLESGGACIAYAHFGHGFVEHGRLRPTFVKLMERLAALEGWYAPVTDTLDHVVAQYGVATLNDSSRAQLETRWLLGKMMYGSS